MPKEKTRAERMKRPAPPPERRLKAEKKELSQGDVAEKKKAKQKTMRRQMVELEMKRAAAEGLGYDDLKDEYTAAKERLQAQINALEPIKPE